MSGDWFRRAIWKWGVPILFGSLILLMLAAPPVRGFTYSILEQLVRSVIEAPKVGDPPKRAAPDSESVPNPVNVKYRFDVTLKIDGEIQHSSEVHEISVQRTGFSGSGTVPATVTKFYGDALEFPLKNNRTLIILLVVKNYDDYRNFFKNQCHLFDPDQSLDQFFIRLSSFSGACNVEKEAMPRMVIVENAEDSRSIREIHLGANDDSIEFVSARVSTTSDPLDHNIKAKYRWLSGGDFAGINVVRLGVYDGINLMKYWFFGE